MIRAGKSVLGMMVGLMVLFGIVACGVPTTTGQDTLKIVAATELKDMQPLIKEAERELGFKVQMAYPDGTIANSVTLKQGGFDRKYDSTWFATNKYVDIYGAGEKLRSSTSIATSPVAFGVRKEKARELGWDKKQPTWVDIAQAVREKKFTYGMTDPSRSNSGFSALVSVATAQADTGAAVQMSDMDKVRQPLGEFFKGQNLTSGSSGWLEDAFVKNPQRTDAILNYESVLLQMQQRLDLQVILPADGVVTADYPLSALAQPSNPKASERVEQLTAWLKAHNQQIVDLTKRRPVEPNVTLSPAHKDNVLIELPFPARRDVADELVYAYANELRQPAKTVFVLDQSGSMRGERIKSLRDIMTELIDGTAWTPTGPVGLRNREDVTLIAFDHQVSNPVKSTYSTSNVAANASLRDAVGRLEPGGQTAAYDALKRAYLEFPTNSEAIPSIVLMSDGASNSGASFEDFKKFHASLDPQRKRVPVFIILYGETNKAEMEQLATLTDGKTFDATKGNLGDAFKEIRGYQ
ncbi:VWA domain-containing protein [Staphylococcus chromogenes]|nr:VWA domain-containing protein [Staphylococcus chromogenes]